MGECEAISMNQPVAPFSIRAIRVIRGFASLAIEPSYFCPLIFLSNCLVSPLQAFQNRAKVRQIVPHMRFHRGKPGFAQMGESAKRCQTSAKQRQTGAKSARFGTVT